MAKEFSEMWTRFLVWALLPIPVMYGLICAAFAFAVSHGSNAERMINVRDFPTDAFQRTDLTGAYLSSRTTPETILFIGSSFTYGYSWAAQLAFPSVFSASTKQPIVNASVIGSSIRGMEGDTLCELKRRALRPRAIVLEIPVINEVSELNKSATAGGAAMCPADGGAPSMFKLVATQPSRALWWDHMRDPYIRATQDYPDVVLVPVPDTYFATGADFERVKPYLRNSIERLVSGAWLYADEVFAFVTPVYGPGVATVGRDRAAVEGQVEFAEQVCISALGDRCIRTSQLAVRRELYANITHLSIKGHAIFAKEIIEPALAKIGPTTIGFN